ncbi:hypothetical protein [Streptomyces mirabilis]
MRTRVEPRGGHLVAPESSLVSFVAAGLGGLVRIITRRLKKISSLRT